MNPEQTLLSMFDHLDQSDYESLLSLMTPDAVWHRRGQRLQGREQILSALNERSKTQRIRHLATNLLQQPVGDAECHISCYLTALKHDDGQVHTGPVPVRGFFSMARVTTRLVRADGRWRVAEQAIDTEFQFSA